jgi:hypothetical protein
MGEQAQQWTRAVVAPVLVGLIAGFFGSQVSLAVHGERILVQAQKIEKLETQMEDLRGMQISMTRLEVQMAQVMLGLERLNVRLESTPR